MSSITLSPNAAGTATFTLASPGTNTNRTITLPDGTTELVGTDTAQTLTNKTIQGGAIQGGAITRATAQVLASGTVVDFTGIPSWAKRVTVLIDEISTTGTADLIVQVGSGSFTTSGYVSRYDAFQSSPVVKSTTVGYGIADTLVAAGTISAVVTIANVTGNRWVESHTGGGSNGPSVVLGAGAVSLSGVLDRVRVTTVGGTDTFDAGTINIMWEG